MLQYADSRQDLTLRANAWPDAVAYREAVQTLRTSLLDPALAGADVALDRRGLPLAYSGRFAVVFRVRTPDENLWAIRCFTLPSASADATLRRRRYDAIARFLAERPDLATNFVPFRYVEQGIRVNGMSYPVLAMHWARGDTLGRFIEKRSDDPGALVALLRSLTNLLTTLEASSVAHGDWQHDNLLVSQDGRKVTLVDYDGLHLPQAADLPASEIGHPNYQHPRRSLQETGVGLDRFAFLVLQAGLCALIVEPSLASRFNEDGESILFSRRDFENPEGSEAFATLRARSKREPILQHAFALLEDACYEEPEALKRVDLTSLFVLPRVEQEETGSRWRSKARVVVEAVPVMVPSIPVRTVPPILHRPQVSGPVSRRMMALAPVAKGVSHVRTAGLERARDAMGLYRRWERTHLISCRIVLLITFVVCLPIFMVVPMAIAVFGFFFCFLVTLGKQTWPAKWAAESVERELKRYWQETEPIKTQIQKRRKRLKEIQDVPMNRSSIMYIVNALSQRDMTMFEIDGLTSIADLPTDPARFAVEHNVEWDVVDSLYSLKRQIIEKARREYEALEFERQQLQQEIDALAHQMAGLRTTEDELLSYQRTLGETRLDTLIARVLGFK